MFKSTMTFYPTYNFIQPTGLFVAPYQSEVSLNNILCSGINKQVPHCPPL